MFKVGGSVICKIDLEKYRYFIGKLYTIENISDAKLSTGYKPFFTLTYSDNIVYVYCDEMSNYFHTEKEVRRLKLEKLYAKI